MNEFFFFNFYSLIISNFFSFSAAGFSPNLAYCTQGKPELMLQKHRKGQKEYWSLFGFWLLDDIYTSISEYMTDIATAVRN